MKNSSTPDLVKIIKSDQEILGQLIKAVREGNISAINTILEDTPSAVNWTREVIIEQRGVDVIKPSDTALMIAARIGRTEVVSALLEREADVNLFNQNDHTALMIAVQRGDTDTIRILLERRADVNLTDSKGTTALMLAAERGDTDTIRILLEYGADVNANLIDNYRGIATTALMLAAESGRREATNELITNTINTQRNNGRDWRVMAFGDGVRPRSQLSNPQVQSLLSEETANLLANILPGGELRNSIVEGFNRRNPQNQINVDAENVDADACNRLLDLRAYHARFLSESGISENQANKLLNEKLFFLIKNPEEMQNAFAKDSKIVELSKNTELLFSSATSAGGLDDDGRDTIEFLSSLNAEEFYKLKTLVLENSRAENNGAASLFDQSLVAVLQSALAPAGRVSADSAAGASEIITPSPIARHTSVPESLLPPRPNPTR